MLPKSFLSRHPVPVTKLGLRRSFEIAFVISGLGNSSAPFSRGPQSTTFSEEFRDAYKEGNSTLNRDVARDVAGYGEVNENDLFRSSETLWFWCRRRPLKRTRASSSSCHCLLTFCVRDWPRVRSPLRLPIRRRYARLGSSTWRPRSASAW